MLARNKKALKHVDAIIRQFQQKILYGLEAKLPQFRRDFDHIVVLGMGGSALAGELLRDLYEEKPVFVVRGYELPAFVGKRSLVLAVSYSGNTGETLALYREAKRRGCQIVSLASGGSLEKLCGGKNFVLLFSGLQPRDALPSMLIILLRIVGVHVEKEGLLSIVQEMAEKDLRSFLGKLEGKIPVVYGCSERYQGLALCWKSMFNENGKILCHAGVFSEVNHNEIEARNFDKFFFLLLDDPSVKGQLRKQVVFADHVFHFHRFVLKGDSLLQRVMYGLFAGGYVTKAYALMKGVDSSRVERIEELKSSLK